MTNVSRVDEPNFFDEPGMANILRVTLLAMLASALAISALTLFLRWRHTPQLALLSAASCLVALALSHSGRRRPAMLLPLLSITYTVLHLAARSDGIQNIGLAIVPVLIMLGSLVLDRLAFVFFSAAEVLAIAAMLSIRYFVLQAERYSANDMGDLFIIALTCATAAVLGRLLTVRIEDGFQLVGDAESRYRRIFENVQDVYYEMNMDGILLELNPAGAALFGIPREEMIGRPLTPFCEIRSQFDALCAAVRAHGRVSNRELVIRDSGAAFHHVLVNASLQIGPSAGEERVIGSIRDITERKRAEEALRESERMFRELLEAMQFVAVVTAQNGKIIFCNDYALAITGWSKDEVVGRAGRELLDPESLLQVADQKTTVSPACGAQSFVEGSILRKNGERRWIRWSSTPLRDLAGRVAGCANLGEDVTEVRALRAEVASHESEARFRNMADWAPVMIWVSGPDKLCTFFNKPWLDFTGRPIEEQMGHGWASGVHPADLDGCLSIYFSAFDNRRKFHREYRLRRADGEYRWLLDNGTPFYIEAEFAGFIGSCIDITERKHAEEALRESEERFRHLADTAPVIIFLHDAAGNMTFFNKQATAFSGLAVERLMGYGWAELLHLDDRERVMASHWATLKKPVLGQLELRLRRDDGQYRWMLTTASPRFVDGEFAGYIGSMIDIDDLKHAQEKILASQKLESLGVLASGIAHDFNNLLGSIIVNAELVLSELPAGSPVSEELESIRNVAGRAAEIVGQMMVYAGQEDTVFESVDLSRLLNEMLRFLKVSISKRATLNATLPEKLPAVRANAAQLRQLVLNLITNASEALGEQDGVVSVAVSQVQSDPGDSTPNLTRGDYVRLEVSDTGCGMTEEMRSKIFDPFFTTKFPGRGMGLAAVKGIVRKHGGTINVVSGPGQGSRFELLLPCSSELAGEGHVASVSSVAGELGSFAGTVLVVEDEDALRVAVSKILRRKGFVVIDAENGKTGVELFRASAREIDVVLLDLTLPGMAGREVLNELRRIQPHVKVIITSAYSRECAQTTLGGGQRPWLFIRKPYQLNELTGLLRNVCLDKGE